MKHNLEHVLKIMEKQWTDEAKEAGQQSDLRYAKLTADLTKDIASSEIQSIVHFIIQLFQEHTDNAPLAKVID